MTDALKIARHVLWADREQAHFDEHGESYDPANPKPAFAEPEPERPDDKYRDENAAFTCLATAVIAQADELAKLKETIAASKEVHEAITIAEIATENERIRETVTQLVGKLEQGAKISAGFCSWCQERWLHPDDATVDDVRELSRVHAYRCKQSPLKLENDALRDELAKVKVALAEACDCIAGTTQCESQYADFHDDPDWKLQERLRRLT